MRFPLLNILARLNYAGQDLGPVKMNSRAKWLFNLGSCYTSGLRALVSLGFWRLEWNETNNQYDLWQLIEAEKQTFVAE